MNTKRVSSVVMLVCLGLALGGASSVAATGPDCSFLSVRSTPEAMNLLWLKSLHQFVTRHPNLSAPQQEVIRQAVALGTSEFFGSLPPASGRAKNAITPAARLLAEATRAFSNDELGEIFAAMGPAQLHFFKAAAVVAAPFCDCSTIGGACQMTGGGPVGVCKEFSCTTYKGTDGLYRIGMCSPSD